jgi:hypothetical protein
MESNQGQGPYRPNFTLPSFDAFAREAQRLDWASAEGDPNLAPAPEEVLEALDFLPEPPAKPENRLEVVLISHDDGGVGLKPSHLGFGDSQLLAELDMVYPDPEPTMVVVRGNWRGTVTGPVNLRRSGNQFQGLIALPPGEYHYQFVVDGWPFPDPSPLSYRVDFGAGGMFTAVTLAAGQLQVVLRNSTGIAWSGELECPPEVLTVHPTTVSLQPEASQVVVLQGGPRLAPHMHTVSLQFSPTTQAPPAALEIGWDQIWAGAMAIPKTLTIGLPPQTIGSQCRIPLQLLVTGRETLKCFFFCRVNGWLHEHNLEIDSPSGWEEREISLPFPLSALGSVPPHRLTIYLDTGCYLENFRFWEIAVHLSLHRMIKNPEFLNFLNLGREERQVRILQLEPSHGTAIAVEVEIPEESALGRNLEVKRLSFNLWAIEAWAEGLAEGIFLADSLTLRANLREAGQELVDSVPILLSTQGR